jgi:hypothetical protein
MPKQHECCQQVARFVVQNRTLKRIAENYAVKIIRPSRRISPTATAMITQDLHDLNPAFT